MNNATNTKSVIPRGVPRPAPTAMTFESWVCRRVQSFAVDVVADSRVRHVVLGGHVALGVESNPGVVEVVLGLGVALMEFKAGVEEGVELSSSEMTWACGTVKLFSRQLSPQAKTKLPHASRTTPPDCSLHLKNQGISIN